MVRTRTVSPAVRNLRANAARASKAPNDYFGRPVQVGDTLRAVGWASDGFPLYATDQDLTVVRVNRTRVVVTGVRFNGEIAVLADVAEIISRDGVDMSVDRDAWHTKQNARIEAAEVARGKAPRPDLA